MEPLRGFDGLVVFIGYYWWNRAAVVIDKKTTLR